MFIDKAQVRGVGGKMSRVGDDAGSYLGRMSGQMESNLHGNDGFATVSTLRQVVTRLNERTTRVADTSRTLGSNVVTAVDNHATVDDAHARRFSSIDLSEVF